MIRDHQEVLHYLDGGWTLSIREWDSGRRRAILWRYIGDTTEIERKPVAVTVFDYLVANDLVTIGAQNVPAHIHPLGAIR